MILRDFSLYLMETMKHWSSLHGYFVVVVFLTTASKGSACEAPSSPQCFRRNVVESSYRCEWSMNNKTESNVMFDLYFNETKFENIKENWHEILDEEFIRNRIFYIWVEAHVGNSSCTSTRSSVVLADIAVKYEAPQNISMSWLKNNLMLSWTAAGLHPALAEVWVRRHEHPSDSWEKTTTNTTDKTLMYQVVVANLLKNSSYQVQVRHQSTQARNSLWSNWTSVTVPAELEEKPEVSMTTRLMNGTREVTLTWKSMPHAAAVTGVTYSLNDTQSSRGCPCVKSRHTTKTNKYTTYISYSAVNISIIARNAAGDSPPAVVRVPAAEPATDLKSCDKPLMDKKKTCHEWYELHDGDLKTVTILTGRNRKKKRKHIRMNLKDYVRYLFFEHRCVAGKPQTVKMCLYYHNEGVPLREPQDFSAFGETHSSANLSWTAIPSVAQRGFLTHYRICSMKISSQDEPTECHNISASLTKHRLENLTPAAKYILSLAGVTRAGEGPNATVTINTLPEKPVNVWWCLGLLFMFSLISTMCTLVLKRIRNKIFPPVPTPIIQDFTSYPAESQEMLEGKEEVHELTLYQLHPEAKSVPEHAEETTVLGGEWDDGTDEDVDDERGDSRMSGGTGDESPSATGQPPRSSRAEEITDLDQVDGEITMIYRNGLVFDVKTGSP